MSIRSKYTMTTYISRQRLAASGLARGWVMIPLNGDDPTVNYETWTTATAAAYFATEQRGFGNIGVVTGQASGVIVVELARREGLTFPNTLIVQGPDSYYLFFSTTKQYPSGRYQEGWLHADHSYVPFHGSKHATGYYQIVHGWTAAEPTLLPFESVVKFANTK